ncbi:glutathione S-transferase family protein [Agrobacterium vitis]|uniref:glutathione S-transferase family protein n=1 Tax=Agrobacterium vitis TaxID=373 RepID=UPI003D2BCF0D
MKLFLNDTSPFARFALLTAIETGRHDLKLEWVDPWTDDPVLQAVTPFTIIPVLETENGTHIYESLFISRYLAGVDVFTDDETKLARFGFAKTLMEVAFRRVILNRFFNSVPVNTLADRGQAAIIRAVQALEDQLATQEVSAQPSLADLALAVALDYTRFRLTDLYETSAGPHTRAWLETIGQRTALVRTQPQALASRPVSVKDLLANS